MTAPSSNLQAPSYRDAITDAMTRLGRDPRRRFIGYGLLGPGGSTGSPPTGALGTLRAVSRGQIVETTVAENLMVGLATGLALAGLKPVVYFERMDFMLNAADATVNHLGALERESGGQFRPHVILRATVGNSAKPLFTGGTHTQDLSVAFAHMVDFPVWSARTAMEVEGYYRAAELSSGPVLIVEYKDLF